MTAVVVSGRACSRCGRIDTQLRRALCHACYEKDRRAGHIDALVDAGPARAHIAVLRAAGWRYREIARAARIDRSVVAFIVAGRVTINARTSAALCGIDPGARRAYQCRVTAKARARKAWVTRRANQAAASQQARFDRARRRAAQRGRQAQVMAVRRAEAARRRAACSGGAPERLAELVAAPADWMVEALCAQTDPEVFFPEKGSGTSTDIKLAKTICAGCPVRQQCLDYALDNDIEYGIWGGLSAQRRRPLQRARRATSTVRTCVNGHQRPVDEKCCRQCRREAWQRYNADPDVKARRAARIKRTDVEHGATRYHYGCRCDVCRQANTEACRRYRRKLGLRTTA